jgi:hypothetical protein
MEPAPSAGGLLATPPELSPTEQEVLDEYERLAENMKKVFIWHFLQTYLLLLLAFNSYKFPPFPHPETHPLRIPFWILFITLSLNLHIPFHMFLRMFSRPFRQHLPFLSLTFTKPLQLSPNPSFPGWLNPSTAPFTTPF